MEYYAGIDVSLEQSSVCVDGKGDRPGLWVTGGTSEASICKAGTRTTEMSKIPKISDEEERELIALSEEDGWVSVGDIEAERTYWQKVAKRTLEA